MSSKLSVELLRMILENVGARADLATICYANKICCVCSQDILYRNIHVDSGLQVCQTLAQSIHLAERVRSFSMQFYGQTNLLETIAKALQNMSSLRNLTLNFGGRYSSILDGCTFKLDSFSGDFDDDESFQNFLNSQPGLTHLNLYGNYRFNDGFEATFLPNLTRVSAVYYRLQHLIPGRPVSEVSVLDSWRPHGASINLSIFTLSTVPIEKLHIPYFYIYGEHVPRLASIFLSLAHLTISHEASPVRVPFSFL
jgi:hypothetical protein